MLKSVLTLSGFLIFSCLVKAQDNYEIQVYGAETVDPGHTMVELHSNYTANGITAIMDGQLPDNREEHETVEITHGWTPWFETGFYFFNSIGSDGRTAYVGSHIRPRVRAPESWKWPVGVSLSTEFGYQKRTFSANTCTLEIRPIIDKKIDKVYLALNPTLDQSFAGPDQHRGLIYSPNAKGSYDVSPIVALGLEYYGSSGPVFRPDPYQKQVQQLFAAIDLNTDPNWEYNGGVGTGFTNATEKLIFKIIIGRRF